MWRIVAILLHGWWHLIQSAGIIPPKCERHTALMSVVNAVGLGFVGGGAITASKDITRKFERYLRLPTASKGFLRAVCIYGLVSRGVVFAVTGLLFVHAGFRVDPEQAGSMGDAMAWVRQLPYGVILYFAAAAGLAAFGIYNLVEARYRVIHRPSLATTKRSMPAIR